MSVFMYITGKEKEKLVPTRFRNLKKLITGSKHLTVGVDKWSFFCDYLNFYHQTQPIEFAFLEICSQANALSILTL